MSPLMADVSAALTEITYGLEPDIPDADELRLSRNCRPADGSSPAGCAVDQIPIHDERCTNTKTITLISTDEVPTKTRQERGQ
jgi:hypothetical protein